MFIALLSTDNNNNNNILGLKCPLHSCKPIPIL
jgi:hypothetical protein